MIPHNSSYFVLGRNSVCYYNPYIKAGSSPLAYLPVTQNTNLRFTFGARIY